VITTVANATVAPLHDRMPVMLTEEDWDQWLDPAESSAELMREMLVPAPSHPLQRHPVSSRVNNVRNEGPELIEPEDLGPSLALG
jgi:putative SOS response-associated peptidase YedK